MESKKKLSFIVIFALIVLNSCELENGVEKFSTDALVLIEENPYVLDKEIILENTKSFFQNQDEVKTELRLGQIESNNYEIKVKNITALLANKSTISRQVAQQIPIYIIQYKDEAEKATGSLVVVGDERFENKVIMFSDEEQFIDYEKSDFWKDMVNGYIYNVVNSFNEETIKTKAFEDFHLYQLKIGVRWHQYGSPYNDYTPFRGGVRASLGCVTVAMGQIMAYHRWPKYGAYEKYDNDGLLHKELTTYQYTWESINNDDYNYQIPIEPSARKHISNLLAEIAYKLNTNFVSATAAYAHDIDAPKVFSQMGYNSGDLISLNTVGESAFFEKIRYEIADCERPVYMNGYNEKGGGHAFVIGGIRTDIQDIKKVTYLYIMNGDGNSPTRYWYISDMFIDPSKAYPSAYNYRYNCRIITGIYPNPSNIGSSSLYKVRDGYPY